MGHSRDARAPGSILLLGSTAYRVEKVEGCGSSSIVYGATYPDSLNGNILHHVLIKELFPIISGGGIFRDQEGRIQCGAQAQDILEDARRRFRIGNEINLKLLQRDPSAISGNLNSYEAYGTYYSVLSVHGGETLLHCLDTSKFTVRRAVTVMLWLLMALEGFHKCGLLHLDISPDNILLLPNQAMLIDFNSVWDTNDPDPENFSFSHKPGYSPPEVLMQNQADISPASDLYACCAVFFHMLAGRRPQEEELHGSLKQSLEMLPCLKDVPQTAAEKVIKILLRGLHILPRRRFASISALQEELEELTWRLDCYGVTKSAIWEASAAASHSVREKVRDYLPQAVRSPDRPLTITELSEGLCNGGRYLLTGVGGMGKTRVVQELWKGNTEKYHVEAPVFFYLSLKDYQEANGEALFVRDSILRMLSFSRQHSQYHGS